MMLLKAAVFAGLVLLVLDALWLGLIARDWLAGQLGALRREKLLFAPAALFYALYAVGLAVFAVLPAAGDWRQGALLGAFLGVVAYGTYDLTNLATLKHWPVPMTVVDILWGAAVSAASAAGAVLAMKTI